MSKVVFVALVLVVGACDSDDDLRPCRQAERWLCEAARACDSAPWRGSMEKCLDVVRGEGDGRGLYCQTGDETDFSECKRLWIAATEECKQPEHRDFGNILMDTDLACRISFE